MTQHPASAAATPTNRATPEGRTTKPSPSLPAARTAAAGLASLAVAAAGLVTAPTAQAAVEWDFQSCATEGGPAPLITHDNPGPGQWPRWTYLVDGSSVGTLAAPPQSTITWALPAMSPGTHRWEVLDRVGQTIQRTTVTAPACPADPDLPDPPSTAPTGGRVDIGEAVCRYDTTGRLVPMVEFGYLLPPYSESAAGLTITADGRAAGTYVVPPGQARLGAIPLTGTRTVLSFAVTGATTRTETVTTPRCEGAFSATPSAPVVQVGGQLRILASGLGHDERVSVSVSGQHLGSLLATQRREWLIVDVPESFKAMNGRNLTVTGAHSRVSSTVSTVTPKTLRPTIWKPTLRRGSTQRVDVAGLAPGEKVVVIYGGKWISPSTAVADARGRYRFSFDPGTTPGRKTVTVRGLDDSRKGSVAFTLR